MSERPLKLGSRWSWLTGGVLAIGFASLFSDLGHEITTALLPAFLVGTLGAPALALGLIEGIADGSSALFKFWGGYAADAAATSLRGRRILGATQVSGPDDQFPDAGRAGALAHSSRLQAEIPRSPAMEAKPQRRRKRNSSLPKRMQTSRRGHKHGEDDVRL